MLEMRVLRRYSRYSTAVLAIFVLLSLAACSGFTSKVSRRFGGKVSFDVELDPKLNQDFPLAVDFVIVYDKDLYAELGKLSAEEWFAQSAQYQRDGSPKKLEVSSWEWVPPPACATCPGPGTKTVDFRVGAQGGIVFADYFNPGVHRIVIEPLRAFTLVLGEKSGDLGTPPTKQEIQEQKEAAKLSKKEEKRRKKQAKKEAKQAEKAAKEAKKAAEEGSDS